MKSPLQSVEVSYFVHATEDRAKVDRAVEELTGQAGRMGAEEAEGHFGNPIAVVSMLLTGEEAMALVRRFFSRMSPELRESLREDLEARLDEHRALYLRLDKQKLVTGRIALGDSDPVRVRIKPRLHALGGEAAQFYRGLLE